MYSNGESTLFPNDLNLTGLTSLHLQNFTFCPSDNDQPESFLASNRLDDLSVDPFSACNILNDLTIDHCSVKDAQTLLISSTTLVNLTLHSGKDFHKIVLSTPNVGTITFTGIPYQQLCGSNLSSLQRVNIDAETWTTSLESPLILLSWLLELANIESLTVSSSTLQVLYLIPDLLKIKLPCLCNLKSLKVNLKPLSHIFSMTLMAAGAKSRKGRKTKLKPPLPLALPDGIVDFLLQNSPSAEVHIIDCSRGNVYSTF